MTTSAVTKCSAHSCSRLWKCLIAAQPDRNANPTRGRLPLIRRTPAMLLRTASVALALLFVLSLVPVAASAAPQNDQIGKPAFAVPSPAVGDFRATATVPTWTGRFTDKTSGKTYPYTMVGTSPWAGSAKTVVPTAIIPIALIFSNGQSLDGGSKVASTFASPLFQPFRSPVGFTQFGDSVSRTSFYS